MRFLSVCSGIEAASVAWEPLGWSAAGFSEIEPFPCHVLNHHYGASRPLFMPDPAAAENENDAKKRRAALRATASLPEMRATNGAPNFGDLSRFQEWPLEQIGSVDLVCGGTPCQAFSVAGLRQGLADPRGNLSLTFLGLVDRVRPRWVLWENVPGVLSNNDGRDFGAFLAALGKLGFGWCYRVLDAQYVRVDGFLRAVPQRRRRVFVVGYLGDWRPPAAVFAEPQSMLGDTAPRRKAGQGFAQDVAPSLVSSGRGVERIGETRGQDPVVAQAFGGGNTAGPIDAAACLTAKGNRIDFEIETFVASAPTLVTRPYGDNPGREDMLVAHPLTAGMSAGASRMPHEQGALIPVAFDCKGTEVQTLSDGSHPPLRSMGHHHSHGNAGGHAAIAIQERAVNENPTAGSDGCGFNDDGVAYTLEARSVPQSVAQAWQVRRLTPVECERLQGFPDNYTNIPWRGKDTAPDGPRYKGIGNSWAVNSARWIGQRIQLVDDVLQELGRLS